MTDYCNQCAEALDDGDTVVLAHDGAYYHYDCWRDGGCEPPGLKPHDYQGDTVTEEHHSPDHYKKGGVECIDICRSVLGNEAFVQGCRMILLQYLFRLGDKDESVKEARKIETYSRWMRETLEGKPLTK
jgi:hypothetical protein